MINLAGLTVTGAAALTLTSSDGTRAAWSANELIACDTAMTRPLVDSAFFARAFLEAGALAWPNGFELSPASLHRRLGASGAMVRPEAAYP
jgi:hypothetical protein